METTMSEELARKAKEAYFEDEFQVALDLLTQAIELNPNNPNLYVDRAQVYIKQCHYFTDALADSNKAIKLDPSMPKAFLRKGTALFEVQKYEDAKTAYQTGAKLDPQDSRFKRFIKACDRRIAEENVSNGSYTFYDADNYSDVKSRLRDFSEFPHEYYQKDDKVFVTIFAKEIPAERVTVEFGERNLDVKIDIPGQKSYRLQVELYAKITPENSSYLVLPATVEIRLAKAKPHERWIGLESVKSRIRRKRKVY